MHCQYKEEKNFQTLFYEFITCETNISLSNVSVKKRNANLGHERCKEENDCGEQS
jgi:hypothetical protein